MSGTGSPNQPEPGRIVIIAHVRNSRLLDDLRKCIAHIDGSASRHATTLPLGVRDIDERLPERAGLRRHV